MKMITRALAGAGLAALALLFSACGSDAPKSETVITELADAGYPTEDKTPESVDSSGRILCSLKDTNPNQRQEWITLMTRGGMTPEQAPMYYDKVIEVYCP